MKDTMEYLRFKTAGYSETEEFTVYVGLCRCGAIDDGVAFRHDQHGMWLLRYVDLLAIAEAATKARQPQTCP